MTGRKNVSKAWKIVTRSARLFYRLNGAAETLVDRLLLAALPEQALADLSFEAYSSHRFGSRDWNEKGLFDWEQGFVEKYLGGEGKRVLVPGCGGGREALHLSRRGCSVVAFDPVEGFLGTFRDVVDREGLPVRVFLGSIEDMVDEGPATGPEGGRFTRISRDVIESEGPYDAVIFGWGSVTHVMSLDVLVESLRLCSGPS
jgi:SAM-dependent methyltransferase